MTIEENKERELLIMSLISLQNSSEPVSYTHLPAIATVRPAVGTVPLAGRLPAVPQHCAQLQYAVSVKFPR